MYFLLIFFSSVSLYGTLPQNVIICGVCRDVADRLPHTIAIMEDIAAQFNDYRIIVYENNSRDSTKQVLTHWMHANSKVHVQCEDLTAAVLSREIINIKDDGQFYRPEEIARARNIVLDILQSAPYESFPYIIWMDMDFKIPPAIEGIIETFQTDQEWDAVFAYGIDPPGTYWDWYAHRDAVYPIGSELLGNDWWYMPKQIRLTEADDWYPVYSAFGGCGIYRKASIQGCRYAATVTEDLEKLVELLLQETEHPQVRKYQKGLSRLHGVVSIESPLVGLPKIRDPLIGVLLGTDIVWRMSSFVYQYPSVCEHVPFHASMIMHGHGKLYINPRLIFRYGG